VADKPASPRYRGGPNRLGFPPCGVLRQLTTNEALACGMTRSSLVYGTGLGSFTLFRPTGKPSSWKQLLPHTSREYKDLLRFWDR
jgi:hypothetical protein